MRFSGRFFCRRRISVFFFRRAQALGRFRFKADGGAFRLAHQSLARIGQVKPHGAAVLRVRPAVHQLALFQRDDFPDEIGRQDAQRAAQLARGDAGVVRDQGQDRKIHMPEVVDRHALGEQLNDLEGGTRGVVAHQGFEIGGINLLYRGSGFERRGHKGSGRFRYLATLLAQACGQASPDYANAARTGPPGPALEPVRGLGLRIPR